ncbi:MAG: DinB family protein [Chloroflexota bacterium]
MMESPEAILTELEAIRTQTLQTLADLSQGQLDWQPPASEGEEAWSLGEVFMHLAIDEFYLRELIAIPLLEGISPPEDVGFLPPPPPYGTRKAVIQFWFERARLQTHRYIKAWPAEANLTLTHEGGLQPMNGLEWLQGYGGHEAFHHQQIETLMAQEAAANQG